MIAGASFSITYGGRDGGLIRWFFYGGMEGSDLLGGELARARVTRPSTRLPEDTSMRL